MAPPFNVEFSRMVPADAPDGNKKKVPITIQSGSLTIDAVDIDHARELGQSALENDSGDIVWTDQNKVNGGLSGKGIGYISGTHTIGPKGTSLVKTREDLVPHSSLSHFAPGHDDDEDLTREERRSLAQAKHPEDEKPEDEKPEDEKPEDEKEQQTGAALGATNKTKAVNAEKTAA